MAFPERLEPDDTGWVYSETASAPLREELDRQTEFTDTEMTPQGHARVANKWRDVYLAEGVTNQRDRALRHYDIALAGADNDKRFETWLLCNRLNLRVADFYMGRMPLEELDEQLVQAIETAAGVVSFRDRKFRQYTLGWLDNIRMQIHGHTETAPAVEDTQSIPEIPAAIGGLVVDGVILEPDAA